MYHFIHVSDVHFSPGAYEKRPAFRPFLEDVETQIKDLSGDVFLILSGDVAGSGAQRNDFQTFLEQIDPILAAAGIPKTHRVCVPGNHDISRETVGRQIVDHEAVIKAILNEDTFNNYLVNHNQIFDEKFDNYLEFEKSFASFGVGSSKVGGSGHSFSNDLGIYCANSAFFSSGGIEINKVTISDMGRLSVGTRDLANWLHQSKHGTRIFVCHHPINWLTEWSSQEIKNSLLSFDLAFFGHEHRQDATDEHRASGRTLVLNAPALLTDKRRPMGYSIASVARDGSKSIRYRQWDHKTRFVSGSVMAGTDSGIVEFAAGSPQQVEVKSCDIAARYFMDGLSNALRTFGLDKGTKWVDPEIYNYPETDRNHKEKKKVTIDQIVDIADSFVISAPPQYGLSCVGWQICNAGASKGQIWLRVDLSLTKQHNVRKELNSLLKTFGGVVDNVAGIVVDSWSSKITNASKCIEAIVKEFQNARIIVLESEYTPTFHAAGTTFGSKKFQNFYLWALKRQALRGIVSGYCAENSYDVDVEVVFNRVLRDLDALNLPRTALNCLTLLLVSSGEAESIVNRAEVIRGVLNVVFHSPASMTYRSRADLKDCEHLLGNFCELIVKSGDQIFSREDFLKSGKDYCTHMLVDVDVAGVLDLLIEHSIIVRFGDKLGFRFSYWIYYFAAARMHHDFHFREYILSNMQYTRFPEVIEFYAGIDRCRSDALDVLNSDLGKMHADISIKTNIASPSKLFAFFRWAARQHGEEEMLQYLENEVLNSSLPQEVKDDFSDRSYDPARPYDQKIQSILNTYSFDSLWAGLRASARALRNSDYVKPEDKERLLETLLLCWEQVQSVLVLISPMLAEQGRADFDGMKFSLDDRLRSDDGSVAQVWNVIPFNVLVWFGPDLTSSKIGPLLVSRLWKEIDPLRKHNVALLISTIRPKGWRKEIERYVAGLDKDSFYLSDLFTLLTGEFKYAYLDVRSREDVSDMAKLIMSKHLYNTDKPTANMLSKINIGLPMSD